ncbi:C-type lectin domain family 6 member A-like [Pseudorasbora parva]|uniref:C-type lectin domain family 6 member A-like n=1 Tax=Pseudorasbora parva TaxID=51549 RepID=UPI00351F2779
MDSIYANSDFILSTVTPGENCSQHKGFFTEEQEREREVTSSKGTKVLLTLLGLSLVFALGGLCALWMIYNHKLADFESQNEQHIINSTVMMRELEELKTNYTGVREQLLLHVDSERALLDKYHRALNCMASCTGFPASSCKLCEDGWTPHRGNCYFFSPGEQTWFESRDLCVASEAHLVTINNTEIHDFLVSKIKETHWIGLNDLETEGHWVWMNNQTLNEAQRKFWFKKTSGKDEPDNWKGDDASGENCACLGYELYHLNSWFDASCKYKKKYICQKTYSFP